jgi:hypothetical protein
MSVVGIPIGVKRDARSRNAKTDVRCPWSPGSGVGVTFRVWESDIDSHTAPCPMQTSMADLSERGLGLGVASERRPSGTRRGGAAPGRG